MEHAHYAIRGREEESPLPKSKDAEAPLAAAAKNLHASRRQGGGS